MVFCPHRIIVDTSWAVTWKLPSPMQAITRFSGTAWAYPKVAPTDQPIDPYCILNSYLHPLGNFSFWQLNHESPVSAITAVSLDSIFWMCWNRTLTLKGSLSWLFKGCRTPNITFQSGIWENSPSINGGVAGSYRFILLPFSLTEVSTQAEDYRSSGDIGVSPLALRWMSAPGESCPFKVPRNQKSYAFLTGEGAREYRYPIPPSQDVPEYWKAC